MARTFATFLANEFKLATFLNYPNAPNAFCIASKWAGGGQVRGGGFISDHIFQRKKRLASLNMRIAKAKADSLTYLLVWFAIGGHWGWERST